MRARESALHDHRLGRVVERLRMEQEIGEPLLVRLEECIHTGLAVPDFPGGDYLVTRIRECGDAAVANSAWKRVPEETSIIRRRITVGRVQPGRRYWYSRPYWLEGAASPPLPYCGARLPTAQQIATELRQDAEFRALELGGFQSRS